MANDPSEKILEIRGMKFPPDFVNVWAAGNWKQPEDAQITWLIPWLQGPVEFIETMAWMVSGNQTSLADHPYSANLFREYRGANSLYKPDLPWIDVDKALFVAMNRIPGDDLGIALDFRTSETDPRVVASYWCRKGEDARVEWRLVTDTFSEFLSNLKLIE